MTGLVRHVIIGTAGHIDHGKTSLVKQLTGIDTDRLPEERARGISIDLGFAHFSIGDVQFGLVDVPGHERFVKNMVAGATGIDLALLVVAADDGVMPQTREHLEIMDLLGVAAGVVAVTKIDLVGPEFVELVTEELAERLRGTFLEGAPVVPVSSATGAGIAQLKQAVLDVACSRDWSSRGSLFRMPIDRVFSMAGHGTVVTGSVMGGEVRPGDVLELLPAQVSVRVRGVQSHGAAVNESGSRQRTAINLASVKTEDVSRGQELAAPGYLQPSRRLLVKVRCLASSPMAIRDRLRIGLHLGTSETAARLVLKGATIEPGATGFAELRTAEPVAAAWGQRFILRRQSPALTIAGGIVLDPGIEPRRKLADLAAAGQALDSSDESARVSAYLTTRDLVDESPLAAAWKAGVQPARYAEIVDRLRVRGALVSIGSPASRRLVHTQRIAAVGEAVLKRVGLELAAHQPRRSLPRKMLQTACRRLATAELLEAAFERLLAENKLVRVGPNIGPADAQVKLSKMQTATRAKILELIQHGGLTPPNVKELVQAVGQKIETIEPLLVLCVEDGLLLEVGKGLYYPPAALEDARQICETLLKTGETATVSQLREAWQVTRKYSVPLCEWFDAQGLTIREGDMRRAGPKLAKPLVE
ncbi:MAG TPA: selenocysteine-specific translation elongation factor [Planctomycetaceae bacterium]|jgi:selenocysteine-specific elongation factor